MEKLEDRHRAITTIGSPIPITRSMMSSRFLSALVGLTEVCEASSTEVNDWEGNGSIDPRR